MTTTNVLAVITHHRYEHWLAQSIESLLQQSDPATAIVVLDDASPRPPEDIVGRYPAVTLLTAQENSGPFALLQTLFETADYDAFLLQDADDWSAPERLATLLACAETRRAEMVGCQIVNVSCGLPVAEALTMPEDARAAVMREPTCHPIIMPASLVSRALIARAGGLSTGLRFGADSEFIRRAIFAGLVLNVPERLYYRRVHPEAMTQRADTGFGSAARQALQPQLQALARANVARVAAGLAPDLAPFRIGKTARLSHVMGPALRYV